MPSAFISTQVIIQLDNQVQPPQWGAPVIISGANVVTDQTGQLLYQPAHMQRPMGADEFTPETLSALNAQLGKLGLEIRKVEAAHDTANPD